MVFIIFNLFDSLWPFGGLQLLTNLCIQANARIVFNNFEYFFELDTYLSLFGRVSPSLGL